MENNTGEFYLYIEEAPDDLAQFVQEFTNQEDLRIFAKGRLKQYPALTGKAYRMRPNDTPSEIMI